MLSLMVCMVCCSKCPVESTFTTSIDLQPIGQVPVRGNPFLNKRPNDCSSQSYQVLLSPEQLTDALSAPFEEVMGTSRKTLCTRGQKSVLLQSLDNQRMSLRAPHLWNVVQACACACAQ